MSGSPLTALGTGAAGLAGSIVGFVAQATDTAGDFGPWITGGGMTTVAGVFLYLFQRFLSGQLLSRNVAEELRQQGLVIAAMAEREDRLQAVVAASAKREAGYARKMEDTNRALWRALDLLEGKKER